MIPSVLQDALDVPFDVNENKIVQKVVDVSAELAEQVKTSRGAVTTAVTL